MDVGVQLIVRSSAQYHYNFFWSEQSYDSTDILFALSNRSTAGLERLLQRKSIKERLYIILQHQVRSREC